MGLKKLIEEHKSLKEKTIITNNQILNKIAEYAKTIIPKEYLEIYGIHYNDIEKKINKNFGFQIPSNYIFHALNSINEISQSEGKYILKKP